MAIYSYGDITVKGITYQGKGSSSNSAVSSWVAPNDYYGYGGAAATDYSSVGTAGTRLYLQYVYKYDDGTLYRNPYFVGVVAGGGRYFVRDDTFPAGTNTVAYNSSGGSTTPSSQTKTYGTNLTIADAVSRTGYTFNGWKSSKTGTVYAAGSAITDTEYATYMWNGSVPTLTLTAQWTINTYTVTLHANGGTIPATSGWTGSGDSVTKGVTYNSAVGTLPTPTRTGYTFNGWFTAAEGGTQINQNTVITGSKAFYAHWTLSTYTYTFDPNNGASGASQTVTRDNGQTIIKADGTVDGIASPTRTGYLFQGWNTSSSATTVLTNITATGTYAKDMTFYAVWQAATSTVTISEVVVDVRGEDAHVTFTVTPQSGVSPTDSVAIVVNNTTIATATATYSEQTVSFDGLEVANMMPTTVNGTLIVKTTTSIDGSVVGSSSASSPFVLENANSRLGGSLYWTDTNALVSSWNVGLIKGKSNVKFTTQNFYVRSYGATVDAVTFGGAVSATVPLVGGYTYWVPNVTGRTTIGLSVTDSRNESYSVSVQFPPNRDIIDYADPNPAITNTVYNQDGSFTCSYSVDFYGYNEHNELNLTFTVMVGATSVIVDGSTRTATHTASGTGVSTVTGTFSLPAGVLQGRTQYTVSLNARDTFSSVTVLAGFATASGKPILDFYKDTAVSLFSYVDAEGHAVADGKPSGLTVADGRTTDLTGDLWVAGDSRLQDVYIDVNESILAADANGKLIENGTVSIAQGGTSANTKNGAQNNLGLFVGDTDKPEVYFSTGAGASLSPQADDLYAWQTPAIPVEYGGTGAGQGEQALVNLGLLDPNTTVQDVPQIYPKYGGGGGGSISGSLSNHVFTTTLTTTSASSTSSITFAAGDGISLSDNGTTMTVGVDSTIQRFVETSGGSKVSDYNGATTTWPSGTYDYSYNSQSSYGYGWKQRKWYDSPNATGGRLEQYVWFWTSYNGANYWFTYAQPVHFDSTLEHFSLLPNSTLQTRGVSSGSSYRIGFGAVQSFSTSGDTFTAVIHQNAYGSGSADRYFVQVYFDGLWGTV